MTGTNSWLPPALALATIVLSALPVALLLAGRGGGRREWLFRAALAASLTLTLFLVAPWVFISWYLRFLPPLLLVAAAFRSWSRGDVRTAPPRRVGGAKHRPAVVLGLLAAILAALAVKTHWYPGGGINLSFPLRSGTYSVLQGGNGRMANPFHGTGPHGMFALDLVKLNRLGNRAEGLAPQSLASYASYGETVYSPCVGKVVAAFDGLPDNPPGMPDVARPEGNHVLLACNDAEVLLAHLQRGSVAVGNGDVVSRDTPLGRIGNSGNSLEPHLHISAALPSGGDAAGRHGVPILFDGSFMALNSIISRRHLLSSPEK